ncbi:tandem-type lipoprotein [Macrococcus capreoli]|uniref:tandem-type lipoprotein n=1 Tax=Macrococcus capreoli TaxID=2982690 RepID=UPI003EE7D9D7
MYFKQKKLLSIVLLFLMLISGCSISGKPNENKEIFDKKVEKSFEKHLSVYPTNNLEDFYDKEGFRDSNFEKDDKGTWIINSYFGQQKSEETPLYSKGVVLFINRNDKSSNGKYISRKININNGNDEVKEYPIKMKDNKLIPTTNVPNDIKEEINHYRFLLQDESFGDLDKLKIIKSRHNKELPLYSVFYQLDKDNNINQWVKNKYKINQQDAKLYIEQSGVLEGSSAGDFKFDVIYNNKENHRLYYREKVLFQPTKESKGEN